MFCSECGSRAEGKFCWNCGKPLHAGAGGDVAAPTPPADVPAREAPAPRDWADEVRYDVLVGNPVVRNLLARHDAEGGRPVRAETVLKVVDKLSKSVVPLETIAELSVPLWTSLGVKTATKTRAEAVARPCGHVIVAVLCSFAKRGQTLLYVDQADDGCTLHADLPSDIRSCRGRISAAVRVRGPRLTGVEAQACSSGQLFDWGKSRACLDHLFQDLLDLRLPA